MGHIFGSFRLKITTPMEGPAPHSWGCLHPMDTWRTPGFRMVDDRMLQRCNNALVRFLEGWNEVVHFPEEPPVNPGCCLWTQRWEVRGGEAVSALVMSSCPQKSSHALGWSQPFPQPLQVPADNKLWAIPALLPSKYDSNTASANETQSPWFLLSTFSSGLLLFMIPSQGSLQSPWETPVRWLWELPGTDHSPHTINLRHRYCTIASL